MKRFKAINNLTGWAVFLIAAVTYLLTIEPTASWWDCGEFISSAFKLEVGHPPGAPLFLMLAKFFSLFVGKDYSKVAMMVNSLSALASGFTILFLFWTITHLARKLIIKTDEDITSGRLIAVMGAGIVGALAYTFSDTFWFSAVEGEVYGMSSFFTAIVFWAILKWEDSSEDIYANKWLILIAYLMGLSIGVHLLNLLAIPAIVFVYYFKKYQPNVKGIIVALFLSLLLLTVIQYGIIPGVVKIASWFELLFVNEFGFGYNTGVIMYAILLLGSTIWGIYNSHYGSNKALTKFLFVASISLVGIPFMLDKIWIGILLIIGVSLLVYFVEFKDVLYNTILLCMLMVLIGYSSFALIVIRSSANPPLDENNPDNVFSLLSYLNREQYGDRPLLYGQYYSTPVIDIAYTEPDYVQKDGKYVIAQRKPEYVYDQKYMTIFPRMYDSNRDHIREYQEWGKVKGKKIRYTYPDGHAETIEIPTFGQNLRYFFAYQLGHMYFRYFMWNFGGKQNDTQGHGELFNGNGMSGFNFIDKYWIGTQKNLPGYLKNDPSRNHYFLLPLLLGLLGLIYHADRNSKDFFVVLLLFILTGIAIVIYLNQYPLQPRERDYAYAGSFYAYAIWIGLGVIALFEGLRKILPSLSSALIATVLLLSVPGIMAQQNWDDHNRSGRYTVRDFACDYLNSCAPNAILFTNGDNDTFPLWYVQEVEGVRRDVRVINLSLFNTDWYINQMRRQAYESKPVPFALPPDKYITGTNDIIPMSNRVKGFIDAREVIDFVNSPDPTKKVRMSDGSISDYIPTVNFKLPVDRTKVLENGTVKSKDSSQIIPEIDWTFNRRYLEKKSLMMLDFLASNNWERPVYFAGYGNDETLGLGDYLQLEGFAYRLVPIKTPRKDYSGPGRIDSDILYNNLMNKFKWGRMNQKDVLIEVYNKRTVLILQIRTVFARLAEKLIEEGKKDSAIAVLDRVVDLMPNDKFPYDYYMLEIIDSYYKAGAIDKAEKLNKQYFDINAESLQYYLSLPLDFRDAISSTTDLTSRIMQEQQRLASQNKESGLYKEFEDTLKKIGVNQ